MQGLIPLDFGEQSDRLDGISSISNNSSVMAPHGNEFSFQGNIQASMPQINRTIKNCIAFNMNEQYTTLGIQEVKENKLNLKESYVKITVIKNMVGLESNQKKEYYINNKGLVDTKKNTNQQDIMIGRQEKFELQGQSIYPNDIVLTEQERLISRIHCKLICKNFFRKESYINPFYKKILGFLKNRLPHFVLIKIEKFLEDPNECYVQDVGSVFGTYIRVDKEYQKLRKSHQYSIGTDTTFQIQDYHILDKNLKFPDENFDYMIDQIRNNSFKCNIHGFAFEQKQYESQPTQQQIEKSPMEIACILQNLKQYNVPFIQLIFSGSGLQGLQGCYLHYLFAKEYNGEFSIGRCSENSIRINSNTISRKQTRIRFNERENKWQIADGSQDRESANGTWLQLSTIDERDQKVESQPHPLKHLSEIKINDYILKVELFESRYVFKISLQENKRKVITSNVNKTSNDVHFIF
ncbi:unnamed protein product (macronuclear) [Paramecium tetraurelia]|uniref:FHA domain-containing protein n=1 Tax=Paramecium tetraurelia TaxID=5888 RepID=A0DD57_PARTE|nr:uncharacterized protein GSPATT00015833001 [Paramecium tetraurelia]CAK80974.1 unnamed protein product [Paramecium tetraurelia]|eukprot:XP_001448371.1 hypothetical protein (macronuclear) [Paramecium tetraurelia strain d4-2]